MTFSECRRHVVSLESGSSVGRCRDCQDLPYRVTTDMRWRMSVVSTKGLCTRDWLFLFALGLEGFFFSVVRLCSAHFLSLSDATWISTSSYATGPRLGIEAVFLISILNISDWVSNRALKLTDCIHYRTRCHYPLAHRTAVMRFPNSRTSARLGLTPAEKTSVKSAS